MLVTPRIHFFFFFSLNDRYEQRAFHYLLDTDKWRGRDLPTFNKEKSKDFMKHFVFLPQCAMNSYTLHPLDFQHLHDRKKAQVSEKYVNYWMTAEGGCMNA
jgi:hypothetical protein